MCGGREGGREGDQRNRKHTHRRASLMFGCFPRDRWCSCKGLCTNGAGVVLCRVWRRAWGTMMMMWWGVRTSGCCDVLFVVVVVVVYKLGAISTPVDKCAPIVMLCPPYDTHHPHTICIVTGSQRATLTQHLHQTDEELVVSPVVYKVCKYTYTIT